MGCTSSAPNMANSSTAEKSIQFEEDISDDQSKDTEEIIYRAENDTNQKSVLPSCDTLSESVHVVRNKSTSSFKTEKDNIEDTHYSDSIHKTSSSGTLLGEEKVPKLEEVVEKVVELCNLENTSDTHPVSKSAEESQQNEEHTDKLYMNENNGVEANRERVETDEDKDIQEHPEEAISPSQSESSRATRWEALADIAAELPPSLTVDPITGQIYAVAK